MQSPISERIQVVYYNNVNSRIKVIHFNKNVVTFLLKQTAKINFDDFIIVRKNIKNRFSGIIKRFMYLYRFFRYTSCVFHTKLGKNDIRCY